MSDTIVGVILKGPQERDAIHCAVAPVIAAERMRPGTHISLNEEGQAHGKAPYLGIVDPFLHAHVEKGEQFYVFLYPRTVTSLKHHWEHPAFPVPKRSALEVERAEEYFRALARDCEYEYDELLAGIKHFIETGEKVSLGIDTPGYDGDELFRHYEALTGVKYQKKGEYYGVFRCAC